MPAGHDGKTKVGAILYSHGYTGTAAAVMRSKWLKRTADRLGVAVIAGKSSHKDWALPNAPSAGTRPGVDEVAYYDRVVADAARRFAIDTRRIMVTGFSAGGMMTWTLACHRGDRYAGFVPIAGTFWRPVPPTCTSPAASVIHLHGDNDKIVPLEGRPIARTHQGSVTKAIAMYARYGKFGPPQKRTAVGGKLRCDVRRNADGHLLHFCLYSGGHTYSTTYLRHAWQTLTAAGRL